MSHRVYASNASGNSAYSNTMYVYDAYSGSYPKSLTVTAQSTTSTILSWTNWNSTTPIYILRKVGAAGAYQLVYTAPAGTSVYIDGNLSPHTNYYYAVYTNWSSSWTYSNEANANTNPPTIVSLTTVSATSTMLSWTNNAPDATGYVVERKTGSAGNYAYLATVTGIGNTTYTDTTMTQGGDYYYHVYAQTSFGNTGNSNEVRSLVAPSQLTAVATSPTSVRLTWNNNFASSVGMGYLYIKYKPAGGSYTSYSLSLTTSDTSATVTGLVPNTTYYFQINGTAWIGQVSSTYYTNEASAPLILFSNVAASTHALNTNNSESSAVQFTIDSAATVTLKVYPEKQGPTGASVYQASQTITSPGTYSFTWDGKYASGTSSVPDEAYLYILEAVQGSARGWYQPSTPTNATITGCSTAGTYDAFVNKTASITYMPSKPARVNLTVNFPNIYPSLYMTILSDVPVLDGTKTFTWDGRDTTGKIMMAGAELHCNSIRALGENVIIITGDTPQISAVSLDPSTVYLSYGEFARIKYTLSRSANVTIALTPNSGGTSFQLVSSQAQSAGDNKFVWDGLDATDVKKIAFTADGYYTVTIQAVNPITGSTATERRTLKIGL